MHAVGRGQYQRLAGYFAAQPRDDACLPVERNPCQLVQDDSALPAEGDGVSACLLRFS